MRRSTRASGSSTTSTRSPTEMSEQSDLNASRKAQDKPATLLLGTTVSEVSLAETAAALSGFTTISAVSTLMAVTVPTKRFGAAVCAAVTPIPSSTQADNRMRFM